MERQRLTARRNVSRCLNHESRPFPILPPSPSLTHTKTGRTVFFGFPGSGSARSKCGQPLCCRDQSEICAMAGVFFRVDPFFHHRSENRRMQYHPRTSYWDLGWHAGAGGRAIFPRASQHKQHDFFFRRCWSRVHWRFARRKVAGQEMKIQPDQTPLPMPGKCPPSQPGPAGGMADLGNRQKKEVRCHKIKNQP